MVRLLLLFSLLVHFANANAIQKYCHDASDLNDKFVCQLYHEELRNKPMNKASLDLKYSRHFMNSLNEKSTQGTLFEFEDIEMTANFFNDLVNVLKLDQIIILTSPELTRFKFTSLKTLMFKTEFKVFIRPLDALSSVKFLDETSGILVFGQANSKIIDLQQRLPEVTWFFNDVDVIKNKSLMSFDSNVFKYQQMKNGDIALEEAYHKPNGDFTIKPWGFWTGNNGLIHIESHKLDRRNDMTGVHIKATTIQNPPFIWIDNEGPDVKLRGFLADVWMIFKENLNFTDEITPSIDGNYGALTENGTWNGMIGMLERNEVDIAVSDATLSESRASVASYSTPLQTNNVKIFIQTPRVDNNDWYLFVNLFRPELWLTMVGVLLPLAFLYTCMISREDFSQGFVIFSGIISGQGSYLEPDTKVPKIILLTLLFSGLILNASYSANLTSNLFIKKIEWPFHDLKSLYHQSDYKVGSVAGTLWYTLFSLAEEGSEEKLLYSKRFIAVDNVKKAIELMMLDSKFAFVWDEESVYIDVPNSCHFQSILYKKKQSTLYMRRGFPYKKFIDHQLRLLDESGQLEKLWNKWKPWKESNCFPIESEAVPFGKIIGPLTFFTMSLVLALIICLLEAIFGRVNRSHCRF